MTVMQLLITLSITVGILFQFNTPVNNTPYWLAGETVKVNGELKGDSLDIGLEFKDPPTETTIISYHGFLFGPEGSNTITMTCNDVAVHENILHHPGIGTSYISGRQEILVNQSGRYDITLRSSGCKLILNHMEAWAPYDSKANMILKPPISPGQVYSFNGGKNE